MLATRSSVLLLSLDPTVTPSQTLLVRSSWPAVEANVDALATRFYAHLFEIDESAVRLFAGVDMTAQRTKLGQTLAVMIATLDDPDRLLPALGALGKRHTSYGIELRHFDSVGDALLWALRDTLGSALTPELHDAWSHVYAVVASVMRRALERQSIAEAS